MIVALEGGVCAGKSSVAAILEAQGVGQHVQEYAAQIPYSAQLATFELDPVARAASFLSLESDRISRPHQTECVILDRSCLTVFAFEYACVRLGANEIASPLLDLAETYALVVPQFTIFLDISDDVREMRLAARAKPYVPILADRNFNNYFKGFFEAVGEYLDVAFVQTSTQPVPEVAETCKRVLARPAGRATGFAPLHNIRRVLGHVFGE